MTVAGSGDWYLDRTGSGARVARTRLLDRCHRFRHGFGTRDGGIPETVRTLRQVHGVRIVGHGPPTGDGLLLDPDGPDRAVGVRTADCVPVLLADPASGRGAAVHAGWRGTAAGIAPLAVALLVGRGSRRSDLVAALGPAIGGCCYAVGAEVALALGQDGGHADLRGLLRVQLEGAGIPGGRISVAPWCTFCEAALFHSFRREGPSAGRMVSFLAAG